jgi:hypothetical protein
LGSLPFQSGFSTIDNRPHNLVVSPSNLAPETVSPGQSGVAVLRLAASTNEESSRVDTMTVTLDGTLPPNQITGLRVFRDANDNGILDATTDFLLTSGNDLFATRTATLTFTASVSSRTFSTLPAFMFVTIDISLGAVLGSTFTIRVATTSAFGLDDPVDSVVFSTPVASREIAVQPDNAVTVSLTSLTPASMPQGSSHAVLRATMTVNTLSAQVNRLLVNRLGSSVDADVAAVKVFLQTVADGRAFNPVIDTLLGSSAFSAGVATVALSTVALNAGTTAVLFVIYEISPTANPGDTLGAGMTNSGYVQSVSPFTAVAGSFPFNSSTGTVTATTNALEVTSLDLTTGGLLQGATNVALLRLTARSSLNPINWSGLAVTRLGNTPDASIDAVKVFRDSNGDGVFSLALDQLLALGSERFTAGQVSLAFTSPQSVNSDWSSATTSAE